MTLCCHLGAKAALRPQQLHTAHLGSQVCSIYATASVSMELAVYAITSKASRRLNRVPSSLAPKSWDEARCLGPEGHLSQHN